MRENITNRPELEEELQAKLTEQHVHPPKSQARKPDPEVSERRLPKGMREKVETVEVSTFKPKG